MVSYRDLDGAKISCFVGSINITAQILAHWTVVGTNFRPEISFFVPVDLARAKMLGSSFVFPSMLGSTWWNQSKKKETKKRETGNKVG
jgi:hypothetical protein